MGKVFGIIKLLKLNVLKKNERMSTLGHQISKIYLTNLPGILMRKKLLNYVKILEKLLLVKLVLKLLGEFMLLLVFLKWKVLKWHKEI